MRKKATSIAFTILLLLTLSISFEATAYGFAPICHVTNVAYNYPNQVNPGEQFPVSVILSVQCPQYNNYHFSARVDVTDRSNRVLASNYTQAGFVPNNGKPFSLTVSNDLAAPSSLGIWQIEFDVYTFVSVDPANGLDYQTKSPGSIQVGQASVQSGNSTTTLSALATANPIISTTLRPQPTTSLAAETEPATSSIESYEIIALALAVVLIVTLVLFARRKKRA